MHLGIHATAIDGGDTTLEVWVGDELVAKNDDWVGYDAGVSLELEAGTTYLVGLGGPDHDHWAGARLTFVTDELPEGAPSGVTAVGLSRYGRLTWTPDPRDAAQGVGRYEFVCSFPDGEELECGSWPSSWEQPAYTDPLPNGVEYSVRVLARNLVGYSEPSETVTFVAGEPTVTTVSTTPSQVVAWEPFDVVVRVAQESDEDWDDDGFARYAGGTVDVTVGGTTYRDLLVEDGVAVVEGVVAPAGTLEVTAAYDGGAEEYSSSDVVEVDVARRADSVTVELDDLVLGEQVTPVVSTLWGLAVQLTASGACRADDGVVTATGVGTCTVVATTQGDADTLPATGEAPPVTVTAPDAAFDTGDVEGLVLGAAVSVAGQGLRPGTAATLVVHSTPRTIATGVVEADGSVVLSGVLPADLEVGEHRLVASGTAVDGAPLTAEVTFTVAVAPTPTPSATPSPSATPAATPAPSGAALAATGSGAGAAGALAAVWLVLGAGLVLVARRRAHHA